MEDHYKKLHKCLVRSCDDHFKIENDRKDHMNKEHYQCTDSDCDERYFEHKKKCIEHILVVHFVGIYSHDSQYCCATKECNKISHNKKDIVTHIDENHEKKSQVESDGKKIKCPKCTVTFEDIHPMKVHYGMNHKQHVDGFTCCLCNPNENKGKIRSNVKRHIIKVHHLSSGEAENQIGVFFEKK